MVFTITEVNLKYNNSKPQCCIWKEILLALIFNIPFFTHGVESSNLTTSIHSGHFISSKNVGWTTTAMIVSTGVTAPLYCYIIDRFGRKMGMFCISIIQGVTLIPHFLWNNKNVHEVQIILHILAGMSSGGLFTVLPIYIREITILRGFCISLMMVLTTLGYMMKLVMCIEKRLYLMVTLVGIQFISMALMLESPSYLVSKGRDECARKKLSKLRRLQEDNPNISKEISNLKDESDRSKSKGTLSFNTVYRTKIWLDAIKMGFVLYTLNVLCGSILFLDQHKTLVHLKTVDPNSVLVLSSLLGGSTFCLICITFLDRKYLLTLGYVVMTLSTAVLAVYTQVDVTVTSYRIVPAVSLGVLVFGYGIVWGLPIILAVEIFNIKTRATFLGIIYTYSQVIKLIHVHTFQYLEDYIGIYTMFYIFAGVNLYGIVYTLFVVPNTRNKCIKQIERQLKRPALPA